MRQIEATSHRQITRRFCDTFSLLMGRQLWEAVASLAPFSTRSITVQHGCARKHTYVYEGSKLLDISLDDCNIYRTGKIVSERGVSFFSKRIQFSQVFDICYRFEQEPGSYTSFRFEQRISPSPQLLRSAINQLISCVHLYRHKNRIAWSEVFQVYIYLNDLASGPILVRSDAMGVFQQQ